MYKCTVTGNVGADPILGTFESNGDKGFVCNVRVYAPHWIKNKDPKVTDKYLDKGGRWVTAVAFGKKAEQVAALVKKGLEVTITGVAYLEEYTKDDGENMLVEKITVESISLGLNRLETVTVRPKKPNGVNGTDTRSSAGSSGKKAAATASNTTQDEDADVDFPDDKDIPAGAFN